MPPPSSRYLNLGNDRSEFERRLKRCEQRIHYRCCRIVSAGVSYPRAWVCVCALSSCMARCPNRATLWVAISKRPVVSEGATKQLGHLRHLVKLPRLVTSRRIREDCRMNLIIEEQVLKFHEKNVLPEYCPSESIALEVFKV